MTSTKRKGFRVETNLKEEFTTTNITKALKKIEELEKNNVTPIFLYNDDERICKIYIKEDYEQNYRIIKGDYAPKIEKLEVSTK